MAEGTNRKIAAAAARAHTRRAKQGSSSQFLPPGAFKMLVVISLVGIVAWAYQAIQPPPPKICGAPGGPPVTAPRIKLRDGRHLAYQEHGIPKEKAKYKVVFIHGTDSCRHDNAFGTVLSQEIIEEFGVYFVSFDRPGYGESDPDPKRTPKSLALDIEELADQLGLGSKFHVIGFSMGGQATWSCLKYIPHRLAGVTLVAPVINYFWHNLPSHMSKEAYYKQPPQDQWALRVAHYAPWLTYWWNTRKWFPGSSVASRSPHILSRQDREILAKLSFERKHMAQVRQQGDHETIYRDMIVGFGTWEFDPLDLENPFLNNEGAVHLWQGDDDPLVPVELQRYIVQRLPWIHYHEIPGAGHIVHLAEGMVDAIIKALLTGGEK